MTDQPQGDLLNELFDFKGRVTRAVFLTYTFDPQYFVDVIYPSLRALGCQHILVLMDATQYQLIANQGDLRNYGGLVIERYKPGVTFHTKLFLLTGTSPLNVNIAQGVIGSANLTQQGLDVNRELFTTFTDKDGLCPAVAELLKRVRAGLRTESTAAELLRETVAELRAMPSVDSNPDAGALVWNGLDVPPLWNQLKSRIPAGQLKKVVIVSPFFEAPEKFDHGMVSDLLKAGVEVNLYVQDTAMPSRLPRDAFIKLFRQYSKILLLYRLDTDGKPLHGKLLVLMTAQSAWLLFGSPNFTAAALQGANVEAGLLLKLSRSEADRYLGKLLTGTLLRNPEELPEEQGFTPAQLPRTTGFILSAIFSHKNDLLTIQLDRPVKSLSPDPADWKIVFNGQAIPADVLAGAIQLNADQIVISGVCQYAESTDGIIASRLSIWVGDHAFDWRLVEMADGELLNEEGQPIELADDLSAFIFGLTQPRSLIRPSPVIHGENGTILEQPARVHMNFTDVEGRLDVAYRFANSLQAHFERLITDPYTIHRWRSAWLRSVALLQKDEGTVSLLGQRLIACRLLKCMDEKLSRTPKDSRAVMKDDADLSQSVHSLLALAADAPGVDNLEISMWLGDRKS